ncbi:MAG: hypothetical protein ACR2MF_02380 [Chthoniobacterales bacterium]
MKPTFQFTAARSRRDCGRLTARSSFRMPKTDFSFQAASLADMGGRCLGARRPSFRTISDNYFKNEASHDFIGEAIFFGIIAMTAALPLISSASALINLVRSIAAL